MYTQDPALQREDCECPPKRVEKRDGEETDLYS